MRKIIITQVNWDGKGNDRVFTWWAKAEVLSSKIERIEQAFNMDHTTIDIV